MVQLVVERLPQARSAEVRISRRQLTATSGPSGTVPVEDSFVIDVTEKRAAELLARRNPRFPNQGAKQKFLSQLESETVVPAEIGTAVSGEVAAGFGRARVKSEAQKSREQAAAEERISERGERARARTARQPGPETAVSVGQDISEKLAARGVSTFMGRPISDRGPREPSMPRDTGLERVQGEAFRSVRAAAPIGIGDGGQQVTAESEADFAEFERRVAAQERRQRAFEESQAPGLERIQDVSSLITFGGGIPVEQRGRVGRFAQEVTSNILGIVPGALGIGAGVAAGVEKELIIRDIGRVTPELGEQARLERRRARETGGPIARRQVSKPSTLATIGVFAGLQAGTAARIRAEGVKIPEGSGVQVLGGRQVVTPKGQATVAAVKVAGRAGRTPFQLAGKTRQIVTKAKPVGLETRTILRGKAGAKPIEVIQVSKGIAQPGRAQQISLAKIKVGRLGRSKIFKTGEKSISQQVAQVRSQKPFIVRDIANIKTTQFAIKGSQAQAVSRATGIQVRDLGFQRGAITFSKIKAGGVRVTGEGPVFKPVTSKQIAQLFPKVGRQAIIPKPTPPPKTGVTTIQQVITEPVTTIPPGQIAGLLGRQAGQAIIQARAAAVAPTVITLAAPSVVARPRARRKVTPITRQVPITEPRITPAVAPPQVIPKQLQVLDVGPALQPPKTIPRVTPRQAVRPILSTIPAQEIAQRQAVVPVTPFSPITAPPITPVAPRAGVFPGALPPIPIIFPPSGRVKGPPFAGVQEFPGAPGLAESVFGIAGPIKAGKVVTPFEARPISFEARRLQDILILGGEPSGIRKKSKKKVSRNVPSTSKKKKRKVKG